MNDKHNDKMLEQVSAWLDGELGSAEARFVDRQLEVSELARAKAERYLLIGDVLRDAAPAAIDPGFADRVRQQIADEPALRSRGMRAHTVGMALAASVTAVAVGGALQLNVAMQERAGPADASLGAGAIAMPASVGAPIELVAEPVAIDR
ncbi:MAG: sigma-E factor negative regulatory protein [Pseudomonadota bacterium]|nr:sigma-E factor negative regulatory protein [Pseudomonadota bacterium]HJO36189.1 sigma-E factor negative regulatory protein [Gammaproteobacteria bacterium]